jgi:transposase
VLHAIVIAADVQDHDGGAWLLPTLFSLYTFLLKFYADGGYQGPQLRTAVRKVLEPVGVEIVTRSDEIKRSVVLPKRCAVERTLAWLRRCRRLAKDWEALNRKARAVLMIAPIRLMVRMLCRSYAPSRTRTDFLTLRID